ncbi:hypothetical protein [Leisingera sp. S232]|uniref:hypothetical protein n=1 Tax=Leisingera sp. S232 TaxID=3415132 RepID=UPI003C7A16F7
MDESAAERGSSSSKRVAQQRPANAIGSEHYRFLEPFTMVGIIFLAISLPAAGLIRLAEGRVRRKLGLK